MSIEELEDWFSKVPPPEMPVYLDAATRVNDFSYFVSSHLEGLRAAKNDFTKMPLLNRLLTMKLLIEANL